MKIEPLPESTLPPGTIIVLNEEAALSYGHLEIKSSRIRVVIKEDSTMVNTVSLNSPSHKGKWSRDKIEGILKKEEINQFLMWDILTKKASDE